MDNEKKIQELYSTMQPLVRAFIDAASKEGYNLRITDGYRSIAEQNALYAQGRTKPGSIVTNAPGGASFHNFALAIDVVDTKNGYAIDWDKLGRIGESVGLEHGDRGFTDRPHFQYRKGLSLEAIQSGARPGELLTQQDMKEIEELKQEIEGIKKRLLELEANPTPEQKLEKKKRFGFNVRKIVKKQLNKLK